MATSARQLRGLGLCGVLGGALSAGGNLVDVVMGHPGRVYTSESAWHLAGPAGNLLMINGTVSMVLGILGVVGLYVLQRGRIGKAGFAGFILLLTAFAFSTIGSAVVAIFGFSGSAGVLLNILVLPSELLLLPFGFLLLGIGTSRARQIPDPFRHVPLILGCYLVAKTILGFAGVALRERVPWASILYRSDSPLGTASSILFGLAVAVIGYSIWSGTRTAPVRPSPT